ncbi:MAG: phosphate/phosphite/phosphonate ABC transporter substrate-binding protein [Gemmataceae bacterium]
MKPTILRRLFVVIVAAGMGVLSASRSAAENDGPSIPARVRIGIMESLFRGAPPERVTALLKPLQNLVETQVGIETQVTTIPDARALGRELSEGRMHLGVFHGHELAWVKCAYPQLRPLVLAGIQERRITACLVVRKDSPIRSFADLHAQKVSLPIINRAHCRLFVDRCCRNCGQPPPRFFADIDEPDNFEDALDNVVDELVAGAVIDNDALANYQARKPQRFAQLRMAVESEVFPDSAFVCHPDQLGEALIERITARLLKANDSQQGKLLMTLSGINGLRRADADYDKQLAAILKAYPAAVEE